jgi:PIN domain nuclease of toxin-antitoxin system
MPKTSDPGSLLLDTHVWLWVVAGDRQLAASAREMIAAAAGQGSLRLSAISLWEVAMLASRGRIVLGRPTPLWLDAALDGAAPAIEPLTPAIAAESCELPAMFHADPADRMIVATARLTNARLMTRDRRILDYAARGHVTAVAA